MELERNGESLVEFLSKVAKLDTSVARRKIVEGNVTVNGNVVDDPSTRLGHEPGDCSGVGYGGTVYPHYP